MRILHLIPNGHLRHIRIGPFVCSMRETPLTLTMLTALAPPSLDINFRLIDENVSKVPLDYAADLVGISMLTGTAPRAYALADEFRRRSLNFRANCCDLINALIYFGINWSARHELKSRHGQPIGCDTYPNASYDKEHLWGRE